MITGFVLEEDGGGREGARRYEVSDQAPNLDFFLVLMNTDRDGAADEEGFSDWKSAPFHSGSVTGRSDIKCSILLCWHLGILHSSLPHVPAGGVERRRRWFSELAGCFIHKAIQCSQITERQEKFGFGISNPSTST